MKANGWSSRKVLNLHASGKMFRHFACPLFSMLKLFTPRVRRAGDPSVTRRNVLFANRLLVNGD